MADKLLTPEERDNVYASMGYGDTKSLREVWEEYGTDYIAKRIAKAQLAKDEEHCKRKSNGPSWIDL